MVAAYRQNVWTAFSEVETTLRPRRFSPTSTRGKRRLVAAENSSKLLIINTGDGLITYLEVATAESTTLNVEFTPPTAGPTTRRRRTLVKASAADGKRQ